MQILFLGMLSVFFGMLGFHISIGFLEFFCSPPSHTLYTDNNQNPYADFTLLHFLLDYILLEMMRELVIVKFIIHNPCLH